MELLPLPPGLGCGAMLRQMGGNLGFMAFLLGICVNASGLSLPAGVHAYLGGLGGIASKCILVLLGLMLDFDIKRAHLAVLGKIMLLKYAITLALGALVWWFLPYGDQVRVTVTVILLCPISSITIRYAVLFGYSPRLAASLVNASTVISFFVLWAVLDLVLLK